MNQADTNNGDAAATHVTGGAPAPQPLAVGKQIDDFLLIDELGEGAFAKVYLAHQKSLHRTVALKISTARSDEAQTLAQLDHPNIVRVYDQRREPLRDVHLLYMEYVPGGMLERVIERVRRVPPEDRSGKLLLALLDEALESRGEEPPPDSLMRARLEDASWPDVVCLLGSQLATALDYAHSQGVLHRDVKPANVLLDGTGRARLADFNISYSTQLEGSSPAEALGGSLPYMSPEQVRACSPFHEGEAEDLEGRSDIFGLGVVLWELLTGELPMSTPPTSAGWKTVFGTLVETRTEGVLDDAIARLPEGTPAMLRDLLLDCLAPAPSARPATGAGLSRRLDLCLDARIRALLTPPGRGWRRWFLAAPLLGLLLTALAPNAFLSFLNIQYNLQIVVEQAEWDHFWTQVSIVNGVAFPIGIAVLVAWAWPIVRAVRRGREGEKIQPERRAVLRRRALRIGDLAATVVLPLWILGGLVFPIWHHAYVGEAHEGGYFHFTLSNLLFGVLAATACFFLLGYLVVRLLVPRLIQPGDVDDDAAAQMRGLGVRAVWYFAACTAVPFVSVVVLSMLQDDLRGAFRALGLMGFLGFGASFWLITAIRRDLDALAAAVSSTGGPR